MALASPRLRSHMAFAPGVSFALDGDTETKKYFLKKDFDRT